MLGDSMCARSRSAGQSQRAPERTFLFIRFEFYDVAIAKHIEFIFCGHFFSFSTHSEWLSCERIGRLIDTCINTPKQSGGRRGIGETETPSPSNRGVRVSFTHHHSPRRLMHAHPSNPRIQPSSVILFTVLEFPSQAFRLHAAPTIISAQWAQASDRSDIVLAPARREPNIVRSLFTPRETEAFVAKRASE